MTASSSDTAEESEKTTRISAKIAPLVLLLLLAAFWIFRTHIHFDFRSVAYELRFVSLRYVAAGVLLIYAGLYLRAVRWAVLLSPVHRTHARNLLSAQFIGFTLVALLGRASDLARPWLIARRLHTSAATQLAVYSIERAFDLAAAAILFSVALAFAPRNMAHHEAFTRAGVLSLAATLLLAIFALLLRFGGDRLTRLTQRLFRPLSQTLAQTASARVLDFSDGMRAISTLREFFSALAISLAMWAGIALTYFCSARAFPGSPPLASFSLTATMLVLASGMGGSLFQLPILGWFTQTAVLAAALHEFFNVPIATATACGAVIIFTTTLSVVPMGLILARIEGITLRDAAKTSAPPKTS
jgi:uncharacterized membrane protein YbhN (UPF0104 family)